MTANVLALVTDAFGGRGGIAQYNRDFLSALAEADHRIVALPRHAPDAACPPVRITQLRARSGRIAYSFVVLCEALRIRPDIVFCGHIFMAPLAWVAARIAGAKLVMQMHGIEAWPRPSRVVRRACESAALILSVSRYTRARVLDWAAISPERAVVLPNTVAECFTLGDSSALRREWGLDGKKVLLTVGRMSSGERYKGHDRVIEALPELVTAGFDVLYIIAGEGDDRARLERLADRLSVSKRVRFAGAPPTEDLVALYRMADLFVMPSKGEGFGIAFLEAMTCGTQVLGLDVAGAKDALCDGHLGYLAEERKLAAEIAKALSTVNYARRDLAQRARIAFGCETYRRRVAKMFGDTEYIVGARIAERQRPPNAVRIALLKDKGSVGSL